MLDLKSILLYMVALELNLGQLQLEKITLLGEFFQSLPTMFPHPVFFVSYHHHHHQYNTKNSSTSPYLSYLALYLFEEC